MKSPSLLVYALLTVLGLHFTCESNIAPATAAAKPAPRTVVDIRAELLRPDSDQVLVAAHRGDWRNAPENSLQTIENAISMGADIVEIDARNWAGHPTYHRIPTLEEAMREAKGRFMVNLNKNYDDSDLAYAVLQETGTVNHAIMKGKVARPQVQCRSILTRVPASLPWIYPKSAAPPINKERCLVD